MDGQSIYKKHRTGARNPNSAASRGEQHDDGWPGHSDGVAGASCQRTPSTWGTSTKECPG